MIRKLVCLLFLLFSVAQAQQVVRRGELSVDFRLLVGKGGPELQARLHNRSSRNLTFGVPAGVKFLGKVEPCAPVYTAQPINAKLGPGEQRTVSVPALSLYDFPHTAGAYKISVPFTDDLVAGKLVQRTWKQRKNLQSSYLRVSQLLVFLSNGMERSKVRSLFTEAELRDAQRVQAAAR